MAYKKRTKPKKHNKFDKIRRDRKSKKYESNSNYIREYESK